MQINNLHLVDDISVIARSDKEDLKRSTERINETGEITEHRQN